MDSDDDEETVGSILPAAIATNAGPNADGAALQPDAGVTATTIDAATTESPLQKPATAPAVASPAIGPGAAPAAVCDNPFADIDATDTPLDGQNSPRPSTRPCGSSDIRERAKGSQMAGPGKGWSKKGKAIDRDHPPFFKGSGIGPRPRQYDQSWRMGGGSSNNADYSWGGSDNSWGSGYDHSWDGVYDHRWDSDYRGHHKGHGKSSIGMPPIAWDDRAREGARNENGGHSFAEHTCPMCVGSGRLEFAPDVPEWYVMPLTGSAIAIILHREGCDSRSISDLMTLASWGERGHQEALYCVHQLLKCPPGQQAGVRARFRNRQHSWLTTSRIAGGR